MNPFTETPDGKIVAVDAKVNFDDNAEFRQKAIHAQRDTSQVGDARRNKTAQKQDCGLGFRV